MSRLHTIIVAPIETEKSVAARETGKYTFLVRDDASKQEIADAIEKYYGVKITEVRTAKVVQKTRTIGRGKEMTKRQSGKKAIVKTEGGKAIDANKITVK
jgi:large subunit ribosomal protein L23